MRTMLVMDTETIIRCNFFINNNIFDTIKFICEKNDIEIKFIKIVMDETDNKYYNKLKKLYDDINKNIIESKKLIRYQVNDNILSDIYKNFLNYFMFFITRYKLDYSNTVINYNYLDSSILFDRFYHDIFFDMDIKNIKDLIIWLMIEKYSNDHDYKVIFISGENIFHKEEMHQYSKRIQNGIEILQSYQNFIEIYAKKYTDNIIINNYVSKEIIGKELVEYFKKESPFLLIRESLFEPFRFYEVNLFINIIGYDIIIKNTYKIKDTFFISGNIIVGASNIYRENTYKDNTNKINYIDEDNKEYNTLPYIYNCNYNAILTKTDLEFFEITKVDYHIGRWNNKNHLTNKEE